jgi:uncharacterized protein YqgC (DUF456 family)
MTPEFWSTTWTVLLWIAAVLLVLLGILGTFLPGLAGAPLVLLGLVLAAWIDGFQRVGLWTIGVLAAMTVLSIGVDLLATTLGARGVGAGKEAIAGAIIGVFAGIPFGLPGLILGPFLGATVGEYIRRRDWIRAGQAGLGTWLGLVLGGALKVALAFSMVGVFVVAFIF